VEDPCTQENIMLLCKVNPPAKEQILSAAGNLANFPKG
jgi:hypothetical protein